MYTVVSLNHEQLSLNSFTHSRLKKAEARGDFALSWFAHKTHYAIPKKSLESGLANGKRLVANVSRSMIQTCLDRYTREITATQQSLCNRSLSTRSS
jgi:ribose 1,5-bisphosphokinase PhnN